MGRSEADFPDSPEALTRIYSSHNERVTIKLYRLADAWQVKSFEKGDIEPAGHYDFKGNTEDCFYAHVYGRRTCKSKDTENKLGFLLRARKTYVWDGAAKAVITVQEHVKRLEELSQKCNKGLWASDEGQAWEASTATATATATEVVVLTSQFSGSDAPCEEEMNVPADANRSSCGSISALANSCGQEDELTVVDSDIACLELGLQARSTPETLKHAAHVSTSFVCHVLAHPRSVSDGDAKAVISVQAHSKRLLSKTRNKDSSPLDGGEAWCVSTAFATVAATEEVVPTSQHSGGDTPCDEAANVHADANTISCFPMSALVDNCGQQNELLGLEAHSPQKNHTDHVSTSFGCHVLTPLRCESDTSCEEEANVLSDANEISCVSMPALADNCGRHSKLKVVDSDTTCFEPALEACWSPETSNRTAHDSTPFGCHELTHISVQEHAKHFQQLIEELTPRLTAREAWRGSTSIATASATEEVVPTSQCSRGDTLCEEEANVLADSDTSSGVSTSALGDNCGQENELRIVDSNTACLELGSEARSPPENSNHTAHVSTSFGCHVLTFPSFESDTSSEDEHSVIESDTSCEGEHPSVESDTSCEKERTRTRVLSDATTRSTESMSALADNRGHESELPMEDVDNAYLTLGMACCSPLEPVHRRRSLDTAPPPPEPRVPQGKLLLPLLPRQVQADLEGSLTQNSCTASPEALFRSTEFFSVATPYEASSDLQVVSLNSRHGRSRLSPEVQCIVAEHRSSCVQQALSGLAELLAAIPRKFQGRSRLSPEVQCIISENRSSCGQQNLSGLAEVLMVTPREANVFENASSCVSMSPLAGKCGQKNELTTADSKIACLELRLQARSPSETTIHTPHVSTSFGCHLLTHPSFESDTSCEKDRTFSRAPSDATTRFTDSMPALADDLGHESKLSMVDVDDAHLALKSECRSPLEPVHRHRALDTLRRSCCCQQAFVGLVKVLTVSLLCSGGAGACASGGGSASGRALPVTVRLGHSAYVTPPPPEPRAPQGELSLALPPQQVQVDLLGSLTPTSCTAPPGAPSQSIEFFSVATPRAAAAGLHVVPLNRRHGCTTPPGAPSQSTEFFSVATPLAASTGLQFFH